MYTSDYIILRDIPASGLVSHRLDRKPLRVATMINEAGFMEKNGFMKHNDTVFFEDRIHDWTYVPLDNDNPEGPGDFRYYTRITQRGDVVIAYAISKTPPEPHIQSSFESLGP